MEHARDGPVLFNSFNKYLTGLCCLLGCRCPATRRTADLALKVLVALARRGRGGGGKQWPQKLPSMYPRVPRRAWGPAAGGGGGRTRARGVPEMREPGLAKEASFKVLRSAAALRGPAGQLFPTGCDPRISRLPTSKPSSQRCKVSASPSLTGTPITVFFGLEKSRQCIYLMWYRNGPVPPPTPSKPASPSGPFRTYRWPSRYCTLLGVCFCFKGLFWGVSGPSVTPAEGLTWKTELLALTVADGTTLP